MKPLRTQILSAAALLLFGAADALAVSPAETLQTAVSKMKQAGDLSPLVEYVDWESYFSALSPEARTALGLNDAAQVKDYYRQRAQANGEDALERLQKTVAAEGATDSSLSAVGEVKRELARQQAGLRQLIHGTSYAVVSSSEDGDKAVVKFTKAYATVKVDAEVELRKVGGNWLFRSAAPLNPVSSAAASALPLGAMPQPLDVLGQP